MTKFNKNDTYEVIKLLERITVDIQETKNELNSYILNLHQEESKLLIRGIKSCITDIYEMLNDIDIINNREFTQSILTRELLKMALLLQSIRHEDAHDYLININMELEIIIENKELLYDLINQAIYYSEKLIIDIKENEIAEIEIL